MCRSCVSSTMPKSATSVARQRRDRDLRQPGRAVPRLGVRDAVAGRILGINPFDQPDVESAKIATRALLESQPGRSPPRLHSRRHRGSRHAGRLSTGATTLEGAIDALLAHLDQTATSRSRPTSTGCASRSSPNLRDVLAAVLERPVTFGWGPRFLHSTGQFHKGGPAVGVFLQITQRSPSDLAIPDSPFTFGQLITYQAAGDASVLGARPPGADASPDRPGIRGRCRRRRPALDAAKKQGTACHRWKSLQSSTRCDCRPIDDSTASPARAR